MPILPNWRVYNHNKAKYTEKDLVKVIISTVSEFTNLSEPRTESQTKTRDKFINKFIEKTIKSLQKIPQYIVIESEEVFNGFILGGLKNGGDFGDKGLIRHNSIKPKIITNSKGKQEVIIKEIIW